MSQKHLAFIQEVECIGCTKCIDICPTDAILGADRLMHTVLASECIGCQLCIPVCPVDCIDLITPSKDYTALMKEEIKIRIANRKERLEIDKIQSTPINDRKDYIKAALLRAHEKKNLS